MAESFNQAWILLGVGMLTVFTVLLLVVVIGNAVVAFVNRYIPEEDTSDNSGNSGKSGDAHKMAVMIAAVKRVTGGKGNIVAIHKKEP